MAYAYVSRNPMSTSMLYTSVLLDRSHLSATCKQAAHQPSDSIHNGTAVRAEHRREHAGEGVTSAVCARRLTQLLAHRSHHHRGDDWQHPLEDVGADSRLCGCLCRDLTADIFAPEDMTQNAVP